MEQEFQYIELSFIKDFSEVKRQVMNTVAITFLLKQKSATTLDYYLQNTQYGFTASALQTGSFRLLRITDINNGTVDWDSVPYCECDNKDVEKYLLKEDDILIARTGGTTGKSFLIKELPSNAVFASYLIRLRANEQCLPEFLDIFLNSYVFWSQISELKSGSAQPNVNAEKLKTLLIPKCSLDDQKKVLALFRNSDDFTDDFTNQLKRSIKNVVSLLEANESIKRELNQQQNYLQLLRKTVLQEAVQGKLTKQDSNDESASELLKRIKAEKQRLITAGKLKKERELPPVTKDEIPFQLPTSWVWCRLGEVGVLKRGKSKHRPRNDKKLFTNGTYPLIQTGEVSQAKKNDGLITSINSYYNDEGLKQSEMQKRGTLCITIAANIAEYGFLGFEACVPDSVVCFTSVEEIISKYVSYYIDVSKDMLEKFAPSTAQKNINLGILNELIFPLPPLSEQRRIVAKVQQIQTQLTALEMQVQQSHQYVAQLLQAILKETFSPKANAIPFERKVLAAHVINMCYQDNYFGLVKFQKTLHVCEHHAQVEYATNYEQEVAGPYDRAFTLAFKKEMIEKDWFQQEMKVSLNRFVPGRNVGKLEKEFPRYFRNKGKEIRFVLQLFLGKTLKESELIATLYAVWNNRIIRKEPTDISQLIDDVYNWSERKAIYSPEEITDMHSWMMGKGLVPTGFGKEITKAANN